VKNIREFIIKVGAECQFQCRILFKKFGGTLLSNKESIVMGLVTIGLFLMPLMVVLEIAGEDTPPLILVGITLWWFAAMFMWVIICLEGESTLAQNVLAGIMILFLSFKLFIFVASGIVGALS